MAAVPHVSSADSLFDSNSAFVGEGMDVSHPHMLPRVSQHSSSGFSTSMSLDFQDKYALERSLPSYSSNFQLAGSSTASWEHSGSNSDAHFFTSNSNAAAQALTMHPQLTASSTSQHEILSSVVDWQHHMGDISSNGFSTSLASVLPVCTPPPHSNGAPATAAALPDGPMVELIGRIGGGLSGNGTPPLRSSPHLLASDTRSGWTTTVDAASHNFIPFANGNASHLTQAFSLGEEDKNHIRSGGVLPLCQSDATKLPVVEAKVEASVETSGAKSMQETSQAVSESVGKEVTGRKRRTPSEDKVKDGSCVTSNGVKNGDTDETKGKRQRNGEGKDDTKHGKTDRSSSENSGSTSPKSVKENSKPPEPPKDYIHVRARRGQATDSHSLAERVRREKISERMKFLQDLVPGCNKVTGKAVMLDEIINYVQSLQRQVEFLSMKLAAVNPRLEFNVESLLGKEMSHGRASPTNFVLGPQSVNSYSQQLHHAQHGALQVAGLDLRSLTGLQEAAFRRGALPCIDHYSDPVSQVLDHFKLNAEL